MTKILIQNGDWDKACAELNTMLDAKRNSFNAQLEAAFPPRKPVETEKPAAAAPATTPANKTPGVILSRPRSR